MSESPADSVPLMLFIGTVNLAVFSFLTAKVNEIGGIGLLCSFEFPLFFSSPCLSLLLFLNDSI